MQAAWFKLNGALRYLLVHSGSVLANMLVVNEYPKSGGSWVGEMLSDSLDIPFPRNRLPVLGACILHGHMMHSWNIGKAVVVWRDGRDVLVSQYYHSLFYNDRGNRRLVDQTRADLDFSDYSDIRRNLPVFMEYVYEVKKHPRFSWKEFGDYWLPRKQFHHVKYESFRSVPVLTLKDLLRNLQCKEPNSDLVEEVVRKHSFEVQSGRKAGEESSTSFLRKGIVGDWKNHFTLESRRKFNEYAGQQLISLGYESDDSWIGFEEDFIAGSNS
jgi:hypothetical protein